MIDRDPNSGVPADVAAHAPDGPPSGGLKALSDADKSRPMASDDGPREAVPPRRGNAREAAVAPRRRRPHDQDDDGFRKSRTPSDAIADEALAAAMPRDVLRRIMRGDPVAVVVCVPGIDWIEPIGGAVSTLSASLFVVKRDGSSRREHVPTIGNSDVADALRRGKPVVGVSQSPASYLPSSLVAGADATVDLRAPDGDALRRALSRCGCRPVPKTAPVAPCGGLTFDEIASGFRLGASGREVIATLARMRAKKAAPVDDTIPPLDQLPGFSGEARRFGERLVVDFARWKAAGGAIPFASLDSAAVLTGPPGVGKSLFARSLARSLGVPIHEDSVGKWFASASDGGALGGVIQAYQRSWDSAMIDARAGGAIYMLDELDGLPSRSQLSDRAREWWSALISIVLQTLTQPRDGMILLGATNAGSLAAPNSRIDEALLRPGRFGRIIEVANTKSDLGEVLAFWLDGGLSAADVMPVVRLTSGASAADAAAWARDAKAKAREAGRAVTVDDVLAVAVRPDARPLDVVRRVAVHEAAHAVVALATGGGVDHATIVETAATDGLTRLSSSGVAMTSQTTDRAVVVGLAGRAAEEIILGAVSAGAEGDLATATAVIAAAHASAGLGAWLVHRASSADAATLLKHDADLRDVVEGHLSALYRDALALVRVHRGAIEGVAAALVERRLLTGDEIAAIARVDVVPGDAP